MKLCTGCDTEKPLDAFWKNQGRCKECRREYDRKRYQTHYKTKRRGSETAWRNRQVAFVRGLKESTPCTDCGGSFHPAAMQFDHLPGFEKLGDISAMIGHMSRKRLEAEIAKCEIVCSNCHAVRTHTRLFGDKGSILPW